eukprot:8743222-Alexandrium_andersonii.AAC.1
MSQCPRRPRSPSDPDPMGSGSAGARRAPAVATPGEEHHARPHGPGRGAAQVDRQPQHLHARAVPPRHAGSWRDGRLRARSAKRLREGRGRLGEGRG